MRLRPVACLVGVGVSSVVAGGVYVASALTATSLAGSFSGKESSRHARQTETEEAWRRASARYATARGKCESLKGNRRDHCNSVARKEWKHTPLPDTPTKETAP